MQIHKWIRPLIVAIGFVGFSRAQGQATVLGNAGGTGDFSGWSGTTTIPLDIRHNGNQSIDFYTDSIQRMQLTETLTGQAANGFSGLDFSGFLGLGTTRPYSQLHIHRNFNVNPPAGYRPWMRTGLMISDLSDMMYVGSKPEGLGPDRRDAVITWSDNLEADGFFGPDHLRLIFTRFPDSTNAASNYDGVEAGRFTPQTDGESVNFGVGDFASTATKPTERLHVNDGTIRIDSLVPDYRNDTLSRVVMTDGTGRLHWRPIKTWPQNPVGGAGCEWEPDPAGNKITTAWRGLGSNLNCPEADWKLGIGMASPAYKMDVYATAAQGAAGSQRLQFVGASTGLSYGLESYVTPASGASLHEARALRGIVSGVDNNGTGVYGQAQAGALDGSINTLAGTSGIAYGPTNGALLAEGFGARGEMYGNANGNITHGYGVYGKSSVGRAVYSYGVSGLAQSGQTNYGVKGLASSSQASVVCYGVHGQAGGPDSTGANGHTKWAGYFVGNTYSPGMVWTASDEQLKQNIEDLSRESAVNKLMQLVPKTYDFNHQQFGFMHLPTEHQYGLLAQNVRDVLPNLVTNIHQPALLDSAGVEVDPALDFSAMNYQGLIPLLIAGFQQQQTSIATLQEEVASSRDELAAMRDQLAACCANPDRAMAQPTNSSGTLNNEGPGREKLHIQPNPFNERTTVYYMLDQGGRAQLMANSADGKELRVLHEATLEKGSYQYEWNTAGLAAGVYYVTLLVDGQPVVKKAVKVDR